MALNGINTGLAFVAQEEVWRQIWTDEGKLEKRVWMDVNGINRNLSLRHRKKFGDKFGPMRVS